MNTEIPEKTESRLAAPTVVDGGRSLTSPTDHDAFKMLSANAAGVNLLSAEEFLVGKDSKSVDRTVKDLTNKPKDDEPKNKDLNNGKPHDRFPRNPIEPSPKPIPEPGPEQAPRRPGEPKPDPAAPRLEPNPMQPEPRHRRHS